MLSYMILVGDTAKTTSEDQEAANKVISGITSLNDYEPMACFRCRSPMDGSSM